MPQQPNSNRAENLQQAPSVPAPNLSVDLTDNRLERRDQLERAAAQDPEIISLAGGLPDPEMFPRQAFKRAFSAVLDDQGCPALQYGWPEGSARLRRYIAEALRARGAEVSPERVLITSGAQQAIHLALGACVRAGDFVGVERESYPAALEAVRMAKARLVGLEESVRAYYVMPTISNPRGLPLDATVRHALLDRARKQKALIIEDDAYADTAFDGQPKRPLLADAPERVFYVGTFSKTLAPGLRVGWLVAPQGFVKPVLEAKQTMDLQANSLAQTILEFYLQGDAYARHLKRVQRAYALRARRLALEVRQRLPRFRFRAPLGGFSLWLDSDILVDEEGLYEAALKHGVSFDRGATFCISPSRLLCLRLSYSAVPEADMAEGVSRLASALESVT